MQLFWMSQLLLWHPVLRGRGTPDFKWRGCSNADKNQPSPPSPKKTNRVSNKTPKIPAQKLTPPPQKKNIYVYPCRILVRAFSLTTLETPKNILCFTTNIMQNDNFRLFWIRKKIPTEIKIFVTKNYRNRKFQTHDKTSIIPASLEIRSTPLGPSYLSR